MFTSAIYKLVGFFLFHSYGEAWIIGSSVQHFYQYIHKSDMRRSNVVRQRIEEESRLLFSDISMGFYTQVNEYLIIIMNYDKIISSLDYIDICVYTYIYIYIYILLHTICKMQVTYPKYRFHWTGNLAKIVFE